jgi:BirA family biotin operon repressor/biotin-[acetyl-CoA-carboxylase] ligase
MSTNNHLISQSLIHRLADGQAHTKRDLAQHTGLTPADIPAALTQLTQQLGLQISHTQTGYHLTHPLHLLHKNQILANIPPPQRGLIHNFTLLQHTDSTNRLARQSPPPPEQAAVWLTEYQTAGRGRRGRHWVGSFAKQLLLSLNYTFKASLHQVNGLSIATGAILAKYLSQQGITGLHLKWPNDLYWHGKKIAGILLEAQSITTKKTCVVIGIGLNVYTDTTLQSQIDQPYTSLEALHITPDRNHLASQLIQALLTLCTTYPHTGLDPYLKLWQRYDAWHGQNVLFSGPQETIQGRYVGLDNTGHLLLEQNGKQYTCHTGTLRLAPNHMGAATPYT